MQSSWGDFSCVDQQLLELSLAQQHQQQRMHQPQQSPDGSQTADGEGTRRTPSIDCGAGPVNPYHKP